MATIQDVLNSIDAADRQYETYWRLPIASAYRRAHENLSSHIDKQRDRDEMMVDLFLTIATICAGAGMAGLFAKSAVKTVAADAAKKFVIANNMVRTKNAIAAIEASKPMSYFVSKSWDSFEKHLKNETLEAVKNLAAPRHDLLTAIETPAVFKDKLKAYIKEAITAFNLAALDIDRSDLSDKRKSQIADDMLASPIIRNAPRRKVIQDESTAIAKLELCMYMINVMNSDHYREQKIHGAAYGSHVSRNDVRSINVPTTDPSYPKTYHRVTKTGEGFATSAKIETGFYEFTQPASVFRKRIDTLHKQLFGNASFFEGRSDLDEVKRAEILYGKLLAEYQLTI